MKLVETSFLECSKIHNRIKLATKCNENVTSVFMVSQIEDFYCRIIVMRGEIIRFQEAIMVF